MLVSFVYGFLKHIYFDFLFFQHCPSLAIGGLYKFAAREITLSQKEVNISQELSALEEKKHALEKVYKIARAVEHLRYGLEALVLLGKPASSISKQAVHVYESLSDKIKILPTVKIQQTVLRLDTIITKNLNTVLQAANPENASDSPDDAHPTPIQQNLDALIDGYRKNAQTAVALRVVLRERGVPTKPITWPVSGEVLMQRLSHIRNKEKSYRKKIDSEIVILQKDAELIIQNDKLPQPTRDAAAHMHMMLHKDLEHIRAGKDIADMPYFIEVVVVQEKQEKEQPKTEPPPQNHTPAMAAAPAAVTRNKNFIQKIWLWATTPLNVKWKDIDKDY